MKIAVPFHNGFVNEHFGHSENYAIFSIDTENKIVSRSMIRTEEGCGCKSGIGDRLAREGVTIMLAGNIGAGAIQHLYAEGIEVVRGCTGQAEDAVLMYLKGEINDGGLTCNHHEGCGDHKD